MTAVTLENLTVSYARHPAVHHVSGTFAKGSLTAIAGPNGAGKSTLLKAIADVLPPDEGRALISGDARNIAYLPQATELDRSFPLNVLHLVSTGHWHKAGGNGAITAGMRRTAMQALAEVGLAGLEKRSLSSLSAGQFQRALFARLLVQDAPLILLDEPFNAIDAETTAHLIELVTRWHAQGRTVICVLHDHDQIRRYFPECLLLARECVAWGPTELALAPARLEKARFFRETPHREPETCSQAASPATVTTHHARMP